MAVALWLGMGFYFTAFAANELFAGLSPDTAGEAVGLLFPTFFTLSTILSALTVLFYIILGKVSDARGWAYGTGFWASLIGFLLCAANQFVLLPRIEHIEAKMGPVSKASKTLLDQFYMLHGISMLLELISLLAGLLVFLILAGSVEWRWSRRGGYRL